MEDKYVPSSNNSHTGSFPFAKEQDDIQENLPTARQKSNFITSSGFTNKLSYELNITPSSCKEEMSEDVTARKHLESDNDASEHLSKVTSSNVQGSGMQSREAKRSDEDIDFQLERKLSSSSTTNSKSKVEQYSIEVPHNQTSATAVKGDIAAISRMEEVGHQDRQHETSQQSKIITDSSSNLNNETDDNVTTLADEGNIFYVTIINFYSITRSTNNIRISM